MVIRGLKRSSGEYEGYKYDNMLMHCLADSDGTLLAGEPVEIVKVPYPVFASFSEDMPLEEVVGLDVVVFYDRRGKVTNMALK